MSSAPVTDSPRERLLQAALQALEDGGPESLQARKLAAQIGTSTMAVYTHFGGMPELFAELIREGFRRFGEHLAQVAETEDPVTDLAALGLAYRSYALAHPQRYRLMFGLAAPGVPRKNEQDLTIAGNPSSDPVAGATFETLVSCVRRVIAAGRIHPADPVEVAGQVWSATHGYVLLEMTGAFGHEDHGLLQILGPMMRHLLVGLGDTPEAFGESARAALETHVTSPVDG